MIQIRKAYFLCESAFLAYVFGELFPDDFHLYTESWFLMKNLISRDPILKIYKSNYRNGPCFFHCNNSDDNNLETRISPRDFWIKRETESGRQREREGEKEELKKKKEMLDFTNMEGNCEKLDQEISFLPWPGSVVGWSVVPICQACAFYSRSGHIQES